MQTEQKMLYCINVLYSHSHIFSFSREATRWSFKTVTESEEEIEGHWEVRETAGQWWSETAWAWAVRKSEKERWGHAADWRVRRRNWWLSWVKYSEMWLSCSNKNMLVNILPDGETFNIWYLVLIAMEMKTLKFRKNNKVCIFIYVF